MVKIKFYDKNQKQFVGPMASPSVWVYIRHFGIWNNNVRDDKLDEMYKIMNRNDPHLELHVKHKGRFTPYSRNISKEISENYKQSKKSRPKTTWNNNVRDDKLKERSLRIKKILQRISRRTFKKKNSKAKMNS